MSAIAVLKGDKAISGVVTFTQASASAPTHIKYRIEGNTPNALRGFHIHEFGDATNGCVSAGGHFNPFGKTHGNPADEIRHVGDMGNVKTDAAGVAEGEFDDRLISLYGENSVVGRSVVIHDGVDDYGKGNSPNSLINGNAGGRPACGVIGFTKSA